jgi:hypothetical protein
MFEFRGRFTMCAQRQVSGGVDKDLVRQIPPVNFRFFYNQSQHAGRDPPPCVEREPKLYGGANGH